VLSIRVVRLDSRPMTEDTITRLNAAVAARPYRRRSDAYRWLRANHRAVRELLDQEPSWHVIAREMTASGITGATGGSLSGRGVRRIWERVCRDLATAEAGRGEIPARALPSRFAAGWHPPIAPTEKPPLQPSQNWPPAHSSGGTQAASTESTTADPGVDPVEAELSGLRERLRTGR